MGIRGVLQERCPFLTEKQLEQFETYYKMLIQANAVMNLTAITEEDEVAVKHFEDSLTVLPLLDRFHAATCADIGTGAGFPGIPLKIARPELSVTLIDSLEKRVGFLHTVIEALGLSGITAIHARAEDAGREEALRSRFDVAVARAVAPMNILSEYCLPFVRPGGHFIAMKGPSEEEYAHALEILGGKLISDELFQLSGASETSEPMTRRILCVQMQHKISTQYPRKAGILKKKPL